MSNERMTLVYLQGSCKRREIKRLLSPRDSPASKALMSAFHVEKHVKRERFLVFEAVQGPRKADQ